VPCWARLFSPHATFGQVPVTAVRAVLQAQFGRWGLPLCLRVDNGVPWGNWNDLPTPLALWLWGLGLDVHWNDPGCPQQNPKIERSQGTGKRWSEPQRCVSAAQLQANLDDVDKVQREEYPTPAGGSRLELFPGLRHSGRPYTLPWEARAWSLREVEERLSEYVAVRKVSATGHVTVYDHGRYVGKQYAGTYVQVQYDPDRHEWLSSDRAGRELRRHPAPEITREKIVKLTFRKKRKEK
jgi:transposase InsO family protein